MVMVVVGELGISSNTMRAAARRHLGGMDEGLVVLIAVHGQQRFAGVEVFLFLGLVRTHVRWLSVGNVAAAVWA